MATKHHREEVLRVAITLLPGLATSEGDRFISGAPKMQKQLATTALDLAEALLTVHNERYPEGR